VATHVERSIEVEVPVRTAYDQWTQFEEFPQFMSGVQEVRQIGDALTHWVAEIAGVRREWDAAILEQVPDQKVAWAATTGATNAGAVYFKDVGSGRTQVRLTLDYEPEGIVERIADVLDVVERQAVADLDRFKEFIESRGSATGGWRGAVDEGDVNVAGSAGAGAAAGAAASHDVSGDLVEVGPTGDTRSTLHTESGPAHARVGTSPDDQTAGVGHSGDPVTVGEQRSTLQTDSADAGTSGPTRDAATSSSTGVAGFGTDTGLSSDDPSSGALTGDPGARTTGGSDTGAATQDTADRGVTTGMGGARPGEEVLDPRDPRSGTADDPQNPQQPSV
jgi:carbon monoxide dehydrogenase subunit G